MYGGPFKIDLSEVTPWFTSDTHYAHKNMVRALSTWEDVENSTRDFKTIEAMSDHVVNQINKYVGEDDILFHLGDWSFGGYQNIKEFRNRIKCKNIYLMPGNHDTHIVNDIKVTPGLYAQELFTEVSDYMEIEIEKTKICMMHYPIQEWNRRHIHLHGHTHARLALKKDRLDVGMDNAFKLFKEYRPFSWGDIKSQLKIK